MIVPLAARWVAAVCGILLLLTGWSSIIGTLIVPRPVSSWMTRWVDRVILATYRLVTRIVTDFRSKDRILATQAAAILITQLLGWLAIIFVGYTFLLWPITGRGIASAFIDAGSSIFTLGFSEPQGAAPALVVFLAAGSGLVIVALQIGYLPTLYAAFNRRETEVALLNARGGFPAWGPELLARTHYGLGTGSTINTLPELYMNWERWAADVGESHSTYLPLVRFRSPRELTSWVTSLLAVLDSAALILTLAPEEAPTVPARLCLRGGFQCFSRIARAMGFELPDEANPEAGIALTFEEFLDAVKRMREVGFPITRDPAEAWREFVGWRVNYEQAAYRIAEAVDAVPALWSGPRHYTTHAIAPIRPPLGRPGKLDDSSYAGAHDRHVAHRQRTRAWRTYLRLSSLLPAQLNRQLQHDSGLSLPEYEVLVQLSEAPRRRLRPFQICEALNWEQSRLSHQLTRMQQRGLVAREDCEADGRGAFVLLAAAGADAIRSAAPGHAAAVRRLIFDRLGDDQRAAFEQACATIIDALTDLAREAGARVVA